MRKYFFCKLFFSLLVVLCITQGAFAQFEEGKENVTLAHLDGPAIVSGATAPQTYVSAGEDSKTITNVVTLKIDEQSSTYFASAFTATVPVKIEKWPTLNGPEDDPIITSLTVNYDPATGKKYNVRAYYTLDKSYEKVVVTIDGDPVLKDVNGNTLTAAQFGWDIMSALKLENEMKVLRYYTLSTNTSDLTPAINTPAFNQDAANNIDAANISWSWSATTNNNMSQLEWAWVEDDMLGFYPQEPVYTNGVEGSQLDMKSIFQQNSTRVDLDYTQNNFSIPLLYEGVGHLYYRIRAAYRKDDGAIIAGPWSAIQSFAFAGHAPNLNWQSSTSYAEDAKLKSVIQYFDGTLRSRQTVTKDYSTGNTTVGETIYDMQGRPNVQILPAPTKDMVIHYFPDFNRFVGQDFVTGPDGQQHLDDPAKYFDLTPADVKCNRSPALDPTYISGSARYYSANNDWLTTEAKSKNIPDALGYPYAETRYMDDPTQRVESQGGVGIDHQIGSGHETKYYYGKPAQQELDALFGTEVGDASHYSKNMVQDANGQVSVSYVDMHGRTIATALAGDPPTNLSDIRNPTDYPQTSGTITNQLLTPATNIINGHSIESVSSILIPSPNTAATFHYSLTPGILSQMNCNNQPVCFDCKYDLEISMRHEGCDDEAPIVLDYNNLQLVPADQSCTTSMGFIGDGITTPTNDIVFTQLLSQGSWVIRKTLSLDEDAFNADKNIALSQFLCTTENDLYTSIYQTLSQSSGCATPIIDNSINPSMSTLGRLRNQMLEDMTPYKGQYAIAPPGSASYVSAPPLSSIEAQYNIFATIGFLGSTTQAHFQNPVTETGLPSDYFNDQGIIDPAIEPTGVTLDRSLLSTISPDNFTSLFEPSWANSLIYYHPEFSKLKYAETNLADAYAWMDNVTNCSTYAQARQLGYINSSGAVIIFSQDPYFTKPNTSQDQTQMSNDISAYITPSTGQFGNTNSSNPSIWQMVNSSILCANLTGTAQSTCFINAKKDGIDPSITVTTDQDKAWQGFVALYSTYRNAMVLNYINAHATNPLAPSVQTVLEADGKQIRFATINDIVNENNWTFLPPLLNSNPTNVTANTIATATADANAYVTNNNLNVDACVAQRPYWQSRLMQCEQLISMINAGHQDQVDAIINQILDGMESVCHNSVTTAQPNGASTVNPSYTGTPQSFEDVINQVFAANGIATVPGDNYFCNPYSVDEPTPFGTNPPAATTYSNTIDECGCTQFAALKTEATSLGYDPTSFTSMNQFLQANYNDVLTQVLWNGLQQCTSAYQYTCADQYLPIQFTPVNGITPTPPNSPATTQSPMCPIVPTITSVQYLDTQGPNNVVINYTTDPNSTNCALSVWPYPIYDRPEIPTPQPIPCGSSSMTLTLPACGGYTFIIGTGGPGNCSQTSNSVTLDHCWQSVCGNVFTPIPLSDNEVIPSFLSCGYQKPCITCEKLDDLTTEFRQIFPAYNLVPYLDADPTDAELAQNSLWTRFINYRTGLTKSTQDYLTAYQTCGLNDVCGSNSGVDDLVVSARVAPFPSEYTARKSVTLLPGFESRSPDDFIVDINPNLTLCSHTAMYASTAICSFSKPLDDPSNIAGILADNTTSPCDQVQTQATYQSQLEFQEMQTKLINDFNDAYVAKCLTAQTNEVFYATYAPSEYHYTLYYYDQAGNLVKTLPPAAVKPNYDPTYLANVATQRALDISVAQDVPNTNNNEKLATRDCYNTLNRVIVQKTPDAGIIKFWYDRLGRFAVSQNAKQAAATIPLYSYTIYDALDRVIEVGEKAQATDMSQSISQVDQSLTDWLNGTGAKDQITGTVYDVPYPQLVDCSSGTCNVVQQNLRNRISYTYMQSTEATDLWDAASFYSYDPHGNVSTLIQDYRSGMGSLNCGGTDQGKNRFKQINYYYDLISGKMNEVDYQPGAPDQFYHKYEYDAENRLTGVQTSSDKIYWEKDACYDYYRHGPLDRVTLGQNQVQGIDYAYTIQGWPKGINSNYLNSATDMGNDGLPGSTNSLVSKDAFAFTLGYFNGDYTPVGGINAPAFNQPAPASDAINGGTTATNLYNGNISYSFNALLPLDNNTNGASTFMGYNYTYDQLSRLSVVSGGLSAPTTTGIATGDWPSTSNLPLENVTYDPNGNIKSYLRYGINRADDGTVTYPLIDNLTYNYNTVGGVLQNNQLQNVQDGVIGHQSGITNDILDGQLANNYHYDAIGNLDGDQSQNIHPGDITWTVYGKIQSITKRDNANNIISTTNYTYDATGNRISKTVTNPSSGTVTTYYVRDATGNVMSVYTIDPSSVYGNDLTQKEIDLYGSDRLGVYNVNVDVENCNYSNSNLITIFTRGNKFFELTNHLGNVMATISDKKLGHLSSDGTTVDYYIPDVVTANDYYPFGMQMQGRSYTGGDIYRYGFNGKELDNDMDGNDYDYGMRIYNPQIGKFLSVDPLSSKYPWYTPYQFAGNTPMWAIDLDGLEPSAVTATAIDYKGTPYEFGGKKPAFKNGLPAGMSNATYLTEIGYPSSAMKDKGGYGSRSNNPNYNNSVNLKQYLKNGATSCGIDCSGLAVTAFNADKEKLMKNLSLSGTSAKNMKQDFINAKKEGTGYLSSDFTKIKEGDPVFNLEGGTVTHVMIATGQVRVKDGKNQIEIIQAPETGKFVEKTWRTIGNGWTYGHTKRSTDGTTPSKPVIFPLYQSMEELNMHNDILVNRPLFNPILPRRGG
jgi:RHS repeat-associated protein